MTAEPQVLIVGAGVIGTSTAYYLRQNHNIRSTLIDTAGQVAPAASGKAGGFLALDWNDGTTVQELTRRSFDLHAELADRFGADAIQYRRLDCVTTGATTKPGGGKLRGVEWATGGQTVRSLGTTATIAQVHPELLCKQLFAASESKLVKGRVVGYEREGGKVVGARLDNKDVIPGDVILYCCGPWNPPRVTDVMKGIKYHSAVLPTREVLKQCVFFSGSGDPEVYVRPDQTAYCTGFPEPARIVTEEPGQESVDQDRINTIVNAVKTASGASSDLDFDTLLRQQACYLPTTNDGIPIIGEIEPSVFIATGHSCWGILMGPATGESMANLIANGKCTVDLTPFRPNRYAEICSGQ